MQATKGDNNTERPMWAERGGLDFEGRARWDAWTAVKAMPQSKAMLQFVKVTSNCVNCLYHHDSIHIGSCHTVHFSFLKTGLYHIGPCTEVYIPSWVP